MTGLPRKRLGDQLLIRFPEGSDIRARLDAAAKGNNRSLSAEVVQRLEQSFTDPESWLDRTQQSPGIKLEKRLMAIELKFDERIEALEKRVKALEGR